MHLYTLSRKFQKQKIIDVFSSLIWTERYYGDSEVELVVPATPEMVAALPVGTFIGIEESAKTMILETSENDQGALKCTGIALLPWLNNRFIRTTAKHEDQYFTAVGLPGYILWWLVNNMCCAGSPYLSGSIPIGIPNPSQLIIPGLGLKDYDKSGTSVTIAVPFGPLYDTMRDIATTYEIGMEITLESVSDTSYSLGFRAYKGLDRTSRQSANAIVRFSPTMESFTNIKELQSIAALKTLVYAFTPSNPGGLATTPGSAALSGTQYTGFDLRALQVFADDITTDQVSGSAATLLSILNSRAKDALTSNRFIKAVDGEIVPTSQFTYGKDYNLGDIIEVQGNSGDVQTSRVTEYIRAQDDGGERAYPTVAALN